MSSGASDMNMYTLFQAISLVMGTAALFYTMKNVGGADGVKLVIDQLSRQATTLATRVFEGVFSII